MKEIIGETYKIEEKIKEGEVFTTYLVFDINKKDLFKLKILKQLFNKDEEFVTNLKKTTHFIANIFHSVLPKVINIGEDEGNFFYVEEYIGGEYLDKILRHGDLTPDKAKKILFQISELLLFLEKQNLIHSSIKASSVWVQKDGKVIVEDFGIEALFQNTRVAKNIDDMQDFARIVDDVVFFFERKHRFAEDNDYLLLQDVLAKLKEKAYVSVSLLLQELQGVKAFDPIIPIKQITTIYPESKDITSSKNTIKEEKEVAKEKETSPVRPRKRGTNIMPYLSCLTILVLSVLVLIFGSFTLFHRFFPPLKEVIVPDITGKSYAEAVVLMQDKNLSVKVFEEVYDNKTPQDHIVRQMPLGGSRVREGREIQVWVSKGAELTIVPDLTSMSIEAAKRALQDKGLKLGKIKKEPNNNVSRGLVISQKPAGSQQVLKNSTIDITLSLGPQKVTVELPDFQNNNINEVVSSLKELKLKVGEIKRKYSSSIKKDSVISQSPSAGKLAEEGSKVDFVVSLGEETTSQKLQTNDNQQTTNNNEQPAPKKNNINLNNLENKNADISVVIPDGNPTAKLKVVVKDASGTKIIHNAVHKSGEKVNLKVSGKGNTKIKVYFNGALVKEEDI